MVHNGIEYAILQLIADAYFILKSGLGLPHGRILEVFQEWRSGPLDSYLIDITCDVLAAMDEDGTPLVEKYWMSRGKREPAAGRWWMPWTRGCMCLPSTSRSFSGPFRESVCCGNRAA